jgi:NADH-quinone oxidoreductase subunit M
VKIPAAPLHTWLPDAHVEAPTPISMILAGVLLKMGGYALMRITYPFFPDAAVLFWQCVAAIGVFGIIYGALCAMGQLTTPEKDWKKLVAYSSVSHMGYVTLGIAVLTKVGWDGAYFEMIAHGIVSAMMFFMVGVVYERSHHRDMSRFGGMWLKWPGYGGWSLICFFAALGLPGLAGFIGEIMVLLGTFGAASPGEVGADKTSMVYLFGIIAASGVILTAGYILWMFQWVFLGKQRPDYEDYTPVNGREKFIMATLGIGAVVFGVVPWLVFAMTDATFIDLIKLFETQPVQAALGG